MEQELATNPSSHLVISVFRVAQSLILWTIVSLFFSFLLVNVLHIRSN